MRSIIIHLLAIIIIISFFVPPGLIPSASSETSTKKGQVIYTNSLNGNLDYCHCPSSPNGGLVKRATAIQLLRNKNADLLLCSTGDFFTYSPDPTLAKYIVKSLRHIDYDAICMGDQEMTIGTDAVNRYASRLPFVCANLEIRQNGKWISPWKPYRVIRKGAITYGITGIMHPSVFKYYKSNVKKNTRVKKPAPSLAKAIRALKEKKVDCIILLSHSGIAHDKKLAKSHPDINIIIGGHTQTLLDPPLKEGNTIIVQAGSGGAHIGILDITLTDGNISRYSNRFILPDENQPSDDSHIRGLIKQYKKEVSKQHKGLRFD
ncbi:MAG: metallophosphoesterase [Spirochaetota bacterium]